MKVELRTDERDGCVATISGCGVGAHTATFRFEAPEYAPDPVRFDGDEVSFARHVLHGSVIVTVAHEDAAELRATLEGFSPSSPVTPKEVTDRDPDEGVVSADAPPYPTSGEVVEAPGGVLAPEKGDGVSTGDGVGDGDSEERQLEVKLAGEVDKIEARRDVEVTKDPSKKAKPTAGGE